MVEMKGLGADSEEKREPVSDIDTAEVDSLKALDPSGRLEKRPNRGHHTTSATGRLCCKSRLTLTADFFG